MMKNMKLETVWRVTLMDSLSVETALKYLESVRCDMIELRSGIYALKHMELFEEKFEGKMIIGGFMEERELVERAERQGGYAVTTSTRALWK